MYAAIDQATSKMEKQLHRLEDRLKHRRDGARQKRNVDGAAGPLAADMSEDEETPEEDE